MGCCVVYVIVCLVWHSTVMECGGRDGFIIIFVSSSFFFSLKFEANGGLLFFVGYLESLTDQAD